MGTTGQEGGGEQSGIEAYRSKAVTWFLLTGNRTALAAAIAVAFGAFFACVHLLGLVPLEDTQALFYAFSGLVAGNLTLITVVVSINQLFLSREIDDLIDRLREIDVARQYFKSLYLQQELSSLSRALLYAGLPAEAVAIAALLALSVPTDQPATAGDLQILLPVSLTIALVPLAILTSVFLRTATVTKRTAATLPFTTPEQERL